MKSAAKRPAKRGPAGGPGKAGSPKNESRLRASKMHLAPKRRSPSPLERAQKLVDKATLSADPERQFELIQQALELSSDCADAFTMLSRFLADRRQALILLAQGLHAAERVLGREKLAALAGKYWRARETRPYMRARLELSECQWALGQRDQSVDHLLAMLRLNPADDQGVRYTLSAHLLELNRDAEFDALVEEYDESTTFILFARLLREFRRSGDSAATSKLLARATRANRFVAPLMLEGGLPEHRAATYSGGGRSEAELYVSDLSHAWKQTPGAITWLRRAVGRKPAAAKKAFAGPSVPVRKQLAHVTQSYETIWQAAVSRLQTWLRDGVEMVRPWSILIVDHTNHKILLQEVLTQEPDADKLFQCLARAMQKPAWGRPHRPSEIQVRDQPIWSAVQPHLQEIGVDCICREELEEADFILNEMQGMMRPAQQPPGLVEIEQFHSSQGASFYGAAADYFRHRPWQRVPADAVIQVDCPQLSEFGSSRWFAVVLGQAGQTLGLALYSQMCDVQTICGGCCSPDDGNLAGATISMLFGEAFEIPISDMLAAEEHSWPLAGPEAYPLILCAEGAMQPRAVQPWELQLLEGCVRAIPDFLSQHPYAGGNTAGPAAMSAGGLKFSLSWVDSLQGSCGSECGGCDDEECGEHCS